MENLDHKQENGGLSPPEKEERKTVSDSYETKTSPPLSSTAFPSAAFEAPPSAVTVDLSSLPLSEELRKQKHSTKRNQKFALGVMGFIVILTVVLGIYKTQYKTSRLPKAVSFTRTPVGLHQVEPEKQKSHSPSLKVAQAPKQEKTKRSKKISSPDPAKKKDYFIHGINRYRVGRKIEAIKAFKEGVNKNPDLKEIGYNNLGVILTEKGNAAKGVKYFKMALKKNPRYVDAHYNLAVVYEKEGKSQKAFFHYQRFLELAQNNYSELADQVKRHIGKR